MKVTSIDETKKHVSFDCGDGRIQTACDLFADTAEAIQAKVAHYCSLYVPPSVEAPLPKADVSKMRAIEGKDIPASILEDVTPE